MKLRLPFPLYRALINSVRAFALTCCLQPLFAQDVLEDVTIPQGTSETYTELDDFEGKSVTVEGTLVTYNPSSSYADSPDHFDVTVQKGGEWVNNGSIVSDGEGTCLNFTIDGGVLTNESKVSSPNNIQVTREGKMNIVALNEGIINNYSKIYSWAFPSADAELPPQLSILLDHSSFYNARGAVLSAENHARDTLPEAALVISLQNNAYFENKGQINSSGYATMEVNIDNSTFVNEYYFYAEVDPKEKLGRNSIEVNVSNGGSFVNNYLAQAEDESEALFTVSEGGELVNTYQMSATYGGKMYINVDGGSLENNGNYNKGAGLYTTNNADIVVNVRKGGDFNNDAGTIYSSASSSLTVNVEDGTFRNEATLGNADVVVGEKGTMTGYGIFGSNDVYGKLVVGSGETGLNNRTAKQQYYYDDVTLRSGSQLYFYIEDRDNYSQIVVLGSVTGTDQWGSIRAAVDVTSEMMAKSVADGDAFMNPGYIVLLDAEGNDTNISDQLGIEYYGVGPFVNKYYYVDPETGSLLPYTGEIEKALLSGSADLIDTLWSSTGSVRNLARTALSQVFLPCYNAERTLCEKAEEMTGQREWQPVHCRRPNVWVAGLGGFINMGGAAAFTYSGGGYAVGADAPLGQYGRVGAAFGQSFGVFRARHSSTAVDQTGIMFSVYGGFEKPINEKRSHRASAYFGYGVVDNDARTNLMGVESGSANWDDEAFVFGLEYAMDFHVRDNLTISPFIGIEYAYGSQSIYAESFSGGLVRRYDGATMQYWRIPVGCAVRHSCALGDKQYLVSELALGYIGDVSRHNPHGHVNIEGRDYIIHGSNPARNALMLRAGTNWLINQNWTVGAQYNLEARSGEFSQSVNAYVRYSF